jgi:hypothetical protein
MKSLVGKFGSLALLTAVAGSMVVGCSGSDEPVGKSASKESDAGSVTLGLVPVTGIVLNSVDFVVTGTPKIAGTPLPKGTLPTPGTDNNFSAGIPVPVGTGYILSLTASSAATDDDITCTGTSAPFDVTPNSAAAFNMTLTCVDNSNGQLVATVNVKTDACPRLIPDYASAIPSTANIGSNIAVNALGHDLDGKTVSYAWSIPAANASVGSFAAAGSKATTFGCAAGGNDIVATVTMSNTECTKTLKTIISCTSLTCGNGVLDAGETCDPNAAATLPGGAVNPAFNAFGCPADCTAHCGQDGVEAPTEQCELPAGVPTGDCTAECRTREIKCGDGFLSTGEACETTGNLFPAGTPAGSTCSATCTVGAAPVEVCGNGTIGGAEQCDPGMTAGVLTGSTTCSDSCLSISSDACVTCEQGTACFEFSDSCITNSNDFSARTAADRTACYDVQECITATGCADGAGTLTGCYCGSAFPTTSACQAAAPSAVNGACAAVIRAAMGTGTFSDGKPTNTEVLERFLTVDYAGGGAIARYNCDKGSAACRTVCGF